MQSFESQQQNVVILGSTGSIGLSTLSVIGVNSERYNIFGLSANTNRDKLYQQCLKHKPVFAVMKDEKQAKLLQKQLADTDTEVLCGDAGLDQLASMSDVDSVMCAIVGAAGLSSSLCAAKSGKKVLLANKEALVMSGSLFMDQVRENNATLIPIDSEHNAIFQCLPTAESEKLLKAQTSLEELGIKKILLTGSGGPFRTTPLDQFASITPEQACNHPNW